MQAYFNNLDILNGTTGTKVCLLNSECTPVWTIHTERSWRRGRIVTKVMSTEAGGPSGSILWKEKAFEVHGRVVPIGTLKSRHGGLFSESRCWSWSNRHHQYKIKYEDHQWKVTRMQPSSSSASSSSSGSSTYDESPILAARLIPVRARLWKKDTQAVLHLSRDVISNQDDVMLLLALLYSEAKRQDRSQDTAP